MIYPTIIVLVIIVEKTAGLPLPVFAYMGQEVVWNQRSKSLSHVLAEAGRYKAADNVHSNKNQK